MTTQAIDPKAIAGTNPGVDLAQVTEALAAIDAVTLYGAGRANYGIQSPYSRQSGENRKPKRRSSDLRLCR